MSSSDKAKRALALAFALLAPFGLGQSEPPAWQAFVLKELVAGGFALGASVVVLEPVSGTSTQIDTTDRHGGGFVQSWATVFDFEVIGDVDLQRLERGIELVVLSSFPHWISFGSYPWQYTEDGRLERRYTFTDLSVTHRDDGPVVGADLGRMIDLVLLVDAESGDVSLLVGWALDVD